MKKVILIILLNLFILNIYSQKTNYSRLRFEVGYFRMQSSYIENKNSFEVSDWSYFGKGINNGETRMLYTPTKEFKQFRNAIYEEISLRLYKRIWLRNTLVTNFSSIFNWYLSPSIYIYENKWIEVGIFAGTGILTYTKLRKAGELTKDTKYLYPLYLDEKYIVIEDKEVNFKIKQKFIFNAGLNISIYPYIDNIPFYLNLALFYSPVNSEMYLTKSSENGDNYCKIGTYEKATLPRFYNQGMNFEIGIGVIL